MKYRWLYLIISGTVILSGLFSISKWGFKVGVDFTGGSVIEYKLPNGSTRTIKSHYLDQSEKDKIVSSAVTNNKSTSAPKKWPKIEYIPITTKLS